MKKLAFLVSLALAGCSHLEKPKTATETAEQIYSELIPQYATNQTLNEGEFFNKYCTAELLSLLQARDSVAMSRDDVGPLDYDLWLSAQDFCSDLAVDSIFEMGRKNEDEIMVGVQLHNCGQSNLVPLLFVRQGEEWKIADFPYIFDDKMHSAVEALEEWIEESPTL